MVLSGGGCALPGLLDPLTGSHSVGPRKRIAAGRDIRHGTLDFAGRRLRLTRPTGSSHRLTLRRPAQAQRRRAMASGTVPVVLPGGGCALPGLLDPLTGSHSVGPRKRIAAGRDFRHGTLDFAGWRLRLTRPTGSHSVGPCKRSAAGRDIRYGTRGIAGWRLRLTRPTGSSHRLTPRKPGKRSAAWPFHSRASLRWFFCRSFFARLSSSR